MKGFIYVKKGLTSTTNILSWTKAGPNSTTTIIYTTV